MEWFLFWLVFAVVVGVIAGSRGRSGVGWFFISVLISPLLGLILVMCLPAEAAPKHQASPMDVGKLARTAPAAKSEDAPFGSFRAAVEEEAQQHRYAEAERQLKGRRQ